MQIMGTLILLFAFSIGTATFIENDFGATAAKAIVYNATWFNILLLILTVNLIGRIIIGRMYRLKKLPIFIFHGAFIIIIAGSAITRFISYEGMMHIREGSISNTIMSDITYVDVDIVDGESFSKSSSKVFMSVLTPGAYGEKIKINNKAYYFKSVKYIPSDRKNNMMNAMVVEISKGDMVKKVVLSGGKGYTGKKNVFEFDGVNVSMTYGAKEIALPFSLKLLDFQLERYPGSNSPSSYASEVELIDSRKNLNRDYRIYMNNVLNYGGYRFFQSSYDSDEHGTILSVAHDYWGTLFTYLGYFFMTLGMLLSIFMPNTRFAFLGKMLKKASENGNTLKAVITIIVFSIAIGASAQNMHNTVSEIPEITKEQAEKFGQLVVQSHDGRLEPVNTLSGEILRKVARKSSLNGLNPDQVFLGMMTNPLNWQLVKMIKVSHPELKKIIGIDGKHASYLDFINLSNGKYKLSKYVSEAYEKKPAMRNKFDSDVLKVDERLNICYMVYEGDMLRILPDPFNSHKPWYSPESNIGNMPQEDSAFLKTILPAYFSALSKGNNSKADALLAGIADYQKRYGASILPSENKIKFEILYNKMLIFDNLSKIYGILGLFMIILLFIEMFKPSKWIKYVVNFFIVLVVIGFIVQTFGLVMRWYISGHAPWSNGYESMIYIGWVTLLAGLLFAHGSKMTIAATTILSSIILMVAHLSWMDPEVTNLVPVLKSYWLTIHVSVITASYGFFALSALLGLLNLILMILKSGKNVSKMDLKINELTAINERSIIIGLYLLTIGTFLGGVWANESWGRYWGWDPKETWALVSILVYAFIAHMRYLTGLKSKFTYNFATLISLGVILMTYFGVNYYLSGLHSYATGDPVPVPNFVYYSIATIIVVAVWAYYKDVKIKVRS